MRRHCFFIWIFLFLPVWAQTPSPTPIVAETPEVVATPAAGATPDSQATPTPEVSATPAPLPTATPAREDGEKVPAEYATPESVFENFVAAMALAGPLRPDQYIIATHYLDLSKVSTVGRNEIAIGSSKQLYEILRTADLDLSQLAIEPGQDKVTIYRQPSGNAVELVRQEDGRWLFGADTVLAVPAMYDVLSKKGKIESWYFSALDFDMLGLNANLWLALLLLPLVAYLLGSLVVMLLRIPLGPYFLKKIQISDEAQKKLLKPFGWMAASLFAWLGLSLLEIPGTLTVILTIGVKIVATIAAITAVSRLTDIASIYVARITANTSTKFDDMLIPLVRRSIKTLVAIIGILFLAQNLDIEVWSLFAGFSIFGAMVALAGQDMVKNFFGSITVLADQPFAVGDWIVVDGLEGVVEDVGFRSTRIRTFYDSVVSLPNSQFITASVDNYGRRKYRRYTKKLSIAWNTAPEKIEAFCEGLRELVRCHPYTRKDSYQIWVNDMNDYSLQILIFIFFDAPDWNTELREKHRFLIDAHRLAKKLGIEFAYPRQKILISRHEDDFDPEFALDAQESARLQGKELTKSMLDSSLPKETPPPAIIE